METQDAGYGCEHPWQEPYVRCRYSPQRTLSVRFRAPLERLNDATKAALESLNEALRSERAEPMGLPFVAYHEVATDQVDLEVGVPVPDHVQGTLDTHVGALPMGRYVTVVQHGLMPALGEIERALDRWLVLSRETADGPLYVSLGHDSTPADGRPIACAFVERQILAGEPSAIVSPRRDPSVPNEIVNRAAAVIGQLPRDMSELRAQMEGPDPGRPLMARARKVWAERRDSMRVEEAMSKDVRACKRAQSLQDVAKLLWDHDIGAVPVIDDDRRPIGMITDRDICMAAYTQGRTLKEMNVASAMSQRVFVCRRHEPLGAAERAMASHQVRRLPVVDDQGALVGMLSLNDIVLVRTRSPLKSAAERLLGDVIQTLAAISQHRPASQSNSAPPKRTPESNRQLAIGDSP